MRLSLGQTLGALVAAQAVPVLVPGDRVMVDQAAAVPAVLGPAVVGPAVVDLAVVDLAARVLVPVVLVDSVLRPNRSHLSRLDWCVPGLTRAPNSLKRDHRDAQVENAKLEDPAVPKRYASRPLARAGGGI